MRVHNPSYKLHKAFWVLYMGHMGCLGFYQGSVRVQKGASGSMRVSINLNELWRSDRSIHRYSPCGGLCIRTRI